MARVKKEDINVRNLFAEIFTIKFLVKTENNKLVELVPRVSAKDGAVSVNGEATTSLAVKHISLIAKSPQFDLSVVKQLDAIVHLSIGDTLSVAINNHKFLTTKKFGSLQLAMV